VAYGADESSFDQRYVVVFTGSSIPADAADLVAAAGGTLVDGLPEVGVGFATSADPTFAERLQTAAGVESVGREDELEVEAAGAGDGDEGSLVEGGADGGTPVATGPTAADDLYADQWNIRRVKADQAWAVTTGSHNTVVAVLDTGIASNHPDVAPNLLFSTCFSTTGTCTTYPESFAGATAPVNTFHGTTVATLIAGVFGGGRVVGAGPNLGLASYKTFQRVSPTVVTIPASNVWKAMLDAANRGFKVINISVTFTLIIGGPDAAAQWTAWNRVARRTQQLGTTIVSSAGNPGRNTNGTFARIPSDLPGVIAVSGTGIRPQPQYPQPGSFDVLAAYSDYGATEEVAAPSGDCGLDVGHTDISNTAIFCNPAQRPANWEKYRLPVGIVTVDAACAATKSCPVGYIRNIGTTYAAAITSGVVGLILDRDPSLNPQQVRALLIRTAEPLGNQQFFGAGMVDAAAALAALH